MTSGTTLRPVVRGRLADRAIPVSTDRPDSRRCGYGDLYAVG